MIVFQGVSKVYNGNARVLDRLDFSLGRGDFVYLIGGSGAGKSSLLRLIATEDTPTEGEVSLFDYKLSQASASTLRAIRQAIGVIPQTIHLFHDLTVIENLALSVHMGGSRASRLMDGNSRKVILDLLERLHLTEKRNRTPGELSGGEAQRVAVARALVRKPELIVADEPTGAQDLDNTLRIMDLILRRHLDGASVLLATHDREIVRRVRKPALILRGGKIMMDPSLSTPGDRACLSL